MDVLATNHGSVWTLTPTSDRGAEVLAARMPEDAPRWGRDGYAVDARYIASVVEQLMFHDGLAVGQVAA